MQKGGWWLPTNGRPNTGLWEDGVAYAQQLVYALFEETLAAADVLAVDDAFVSELKEKFSRLDNGLHIGSWGQIKEWTIQEDKQGDHQRHLSHLMALYPLRPDFLPERQTLCRGGQSGFGFTGRRCHGMEPGLESGLLGTFVGWRTGLPFAETSTKYYRRDGGEHGRQCRRRV